MSTEKYVNLNGSYGPYAYFAPTRAWDGPYAYGAIYVPYTRMGIPYMFGAPYAMYGAEF